jgi:transmembrane sensor
MNPEIEHAAAEWIARRYAGFSPAEHTAFERWLAADPRNAATFAELDATWRALDRVRGSAPAGRPDPEALRPDGGPVGWRRFAPGLAAAAAAVLLVAGAWSLGRPKLAQQAWRSPSLETPFAETVTTAVGAMQKLTLPDGSVVRLNTDSRVEVDFVPEARWVRLVRGEAHFTVAKNPLRPFLVEAGGVALRAVGTAFNVRIQPEAVEVLVTEGKVRVIAAAPAGDAVAPPAVAASRPEIPLLTAGERVVIPAAAVPGDGRGAVPVAKMAPADVERALAWQERRLEFVAAPLAEIVAEFNRYNRFQLSVVDPALAARRFGGSFRADEPETFVRLLESRFGLRAVRQGGVTVLHAGN